MIQILIADDHPLLREALRTLIEDENDLEIVAEVTNGIEAIQKILELKPDVIILDLSLPEMDGITVMHHIVPQLPDVRILVFTSSTEEMKVMEGIRAGAAGYLIKDARREEILHAIRTLHAGKQYFPPVILEKLANALRKETTQKENVVSEELTDKEREVLDYIKQGASNFEIAHQMYISETTVRTHVYHILQKMGFSTRNELVLHFLKQKGK